MTQSLVRGWGQSAAATHMLILIDCSHRICIDGCRASGAAKPDGSRDPCEPGDGRSCSRHQAGAFDTRLTGSNGGGTIGEMER